MTWLFVELALMLAVILIASELFTNALEHLGERLGISEGVTGSAVRGGARRRVRAVCDFDRASAQLVEGGHGTEAPEALFVSRLGLKTSLGTIMLQFLIDIVLLVGGAKGFIHVVEGMSHVLGVSLLLLSLIIIRIATELPEKVNSILWARRGKDTLAFGNIIGAMVFQGSLLPAIGIMLTPWEPRVEVLTGVLITLAAAAWLRFNARTNGVVRGRCWAMACSMPRILC